jgi:hypothetical protein
LVYVRFHALIIVSLAFHPDRVVLAWRSTPVLVIVMNPEPGSGAYEDDTP